MRVLVRTCLTTTTLSTLLGLVILANPAAAADPDNIWAKENWMFRLRAIDVAPDESSKVNIGGHASVDNTVVPEFDISYFFTDNISAELILATSRHNLT